MTNVCKTAPTASEKRLKTVAMLAGQRVPAGDRALPAYNGRKEPALVEILDDPITRRLMDSDGVHYDHLMTVIKAARIRLRG